MDTGLILFARKAEDLLYNGKSSEALDICLSGIESYPEYPMGYLMLSQCLFELDDLNGAMTSAKRGLTLYPDYKPLMKYLLLLEDSIVIHEISSELEKEYESMDEENTDEVQNENNSTGEESITLSPQTSFLKLVSNYETDEPNRSNLTSESPAILPGLSYAPLRATRSANMDLPISQSLNFPEFYNPYEAKEDSDKSIETNEEAYFTTETMASILEAQGAYKEAIEAFSHLAKLHPEQAARFNEKILFLRNKINVK
jgi:tetratricopeptide (TPR) repeat protein